MLRRAWLQSGRRGGAVTRGVDYKAVTRVQGAVVWKFRRADAKHDDVLQEVPCAHCGLPTTAIQHEQHVFCCHGCQGAYSLIHQMGLDDYYALRDTSFDPTLPGSGPEFLGSESTRAAVDMLNDLDAAGVVVQKTADGLCEVRLGVEGLHCAACSWLIERIQPTIAGVHAAQVRMNDRSIRLVYDSQVTSPAQVARQLARLGYVLLPMHDDEAIKNSFLRQQQDHWVAIAAAAFLAANAMWMGIALYAGESTGMAPVHTHFLRWIGTLLGVLSSVFPGRVFFRSAIQAIRSRTAHVDVPVALALGMGTLGSIWGSATGRGHVYFDSLASLVLLLRVGRYIQFRSQYHTSLSLSKLFRWRQTMAQRIESDGTIRTVSTARLSKDDVVLVQPGQTLPADGIIVNGHSHLNVSWLSGESQPLSVSVDDRVIGGTMNIDSPLRIRVTESGKQSRIGQLEEVISSAAGKRTPLVRSADKIGQWFVVVVLCLAAITWLVWFFRADLETATLHTVALLTIACPCAIALAAPLVITVTIGRAARNQIWIRDGECIERLAQPGIIWFDKTGTLTAGEMRVDSWDGSKRSLEYAAAIESYVQHPLARAICDHVRADQGDIEYQVDSFRAWEGLGISGMIDGCDVLVGSERLMREHRISIEDAWLAQQTATLADGRTPVWVAIDGRIEGIGAIGDYLRPDAIQTLSRLQVQGWKLGILSGDRQAVINYWETKLAKIGIHFDQCWGDCTPEEKMSKVQASSNAKSGCVVFVGDGINDAAALAVADVGIAIRGGSDIGLRAAPVYIADNRLSSIERLFRASEASVQTIRRCFGMSLVYNTITISLAMLGWIHPLIAALFMPLSGVTVLALAITGKPFPEAEQK